MFEHFSDVRADLERKGETFGPDSLKRLSFNDLFLAAIGNAGKQACSFALVKAEEDNRKAPFSHLNAEEVATVELPEEDVRESLFADLAKAAGLIQNPTALEPQVQLHRAMRSLRGDWSAGRASPYLAAIYSLLEPCKTVLPPLFLEAVKQNANTFDGHYNDGRIMRDGQLLLSSDIASGLGIGTTGTEPLPGTTAVSGNLAAMLGARPLLREGGYYGTYDELWEMLTPSQKVDALRQMSVQDF